jgi:hypothetical protein
MSLSNPKNLKEWVDHILSEIPEQDLLHQASVIASQKFQDSLEEEGYVSSDLLTIYRTMALRMKRTGVRVPRQIAGTSVDYASLLEQAQLEKQLESSLIDDGDLG